MLSKEQIEGHKRLAQSYVKANALGALVDANHLIALCNLALSSIAMREALKPRPIEEAPKDGTRILAWWGGEWVITYWVNRSGDGKRHPGFEGWKIPSGMTVKAYDRDAWQPTLFTSLPDRAAEAYQEQGK